MYDRILIHVDHTRAFEAALPFLQDTLRNNIAKKAVLSTVVKPCAPTLYGYILEPDEISRTDDSNVAKAADFLQRIAARIEATGVQVQTRVLVGDPAESFREFASYGRFDLVVIAPTGRRYLLTGKSREFRRALRTLAKPIMILQALPVPATP